MTDWLSYLMGFAQHAATKSKDSTQVGAVLVAENGRTVLLTAYNGPPAGVDDLPERRERPAKYLFASHAEANLVAFAAREGVRTKACTVYVTHHPCSACARALIQAGIREVVYGFGKTSMPAEEFKAAAVMFEEAGVDTFCFDPVSSSSEERSAEGNG
jgi:dCMP deaminase